MPPKAFLLSVKKPDAIYFPTESPTLADDEGLLHTTPSGCQHWWAVNACTYAGEAICLISVIVSPEQTLFCNPNIDQPLYKVFTPANGILVRVCSCGKIPWQF